MTGPKTCLGVCSECGGRVIAPDDSYSTILIPPTCEGCGAIPRVCAPPVVEMTRPVPVPKTLEDSKQILRELSEDRSVWLGRRAPRPLGGLIFGATLALLSFFPLRAMALDVTVFEGSANCKGDGMTAITRAFLGQPFDPAVLDQCRINKTCKGTQEKRRTCTVSTRHGHPSNNWVPPMRMSDVMQGSIRYEDSGLIQFFTDQGAWNLNGGELGSHVYSAINLSSAAAFLAVMRERGHARAVEDASTWLRAYWAWYALQAKKERPVQICYRLGVDGDEGCVSARNEWGVSGPFSHHVGERSAHGEKKGAIRSSAAAYYSIDAGSHLFAWATGLAGGRVPVSGAQPHDEPHWPHWMLAKVAGVSRFGAKVKPELFGLTKSERGDLVKFVRDPTSPKKRDAVLEMMAGYGSATGRIAITRYQNGETSSMLSPGINTVTFGAVNLVWSHGSKAHAVAGSNRYYPGGGFRSLRSWCRPLPDGVYECGSYCRVDGKDLECRGFSVQGPTWPVAWSVVIDARGARVEGQASTAKPTESEQLELDRIAAKPHLEKAVRALRDARKASKSETARKWLADRIRELKAAKKVGAGA